MATRGRYTNGVLEYYESTTGEVVRRETAVQLSEEFFSVDRLGSTTSNNGFMATLPGTGDSITLNTLTNRVGVGRLSTGTVDNDTAFVNRIYSVQSVVSPTIQAVVSPASLTNIAFGVGFCTSAGLGNAGPLKQDGTTWTTTGTDCVGIHFDALATNKTFYCMACNNNVDATAYNTTVAPVGGSFNVLRVDLQDNGTATTAKCYIDGVLKKTFTVAVTRTTGLYAYVAASTRNNASSQLLDLDNVRFWSNRP